MASTSAAVRSTRGCREQFLNPTASTDPMATSTIETLTSIGSLMSATRARDVDHPLPDAGEGKADILRRLSFLKPWPVATQMRGSSVTPAASELRLEVVVHELRVERVHVHAGQVMSVAQEAAGPCAVIVPHGGRHLLHALDVEEHHRAHGKSFLQRHRDGIDAIGVATLGRDEVGIAAAALLLELRHALRARLRRAAPRLLTDIDHSHAPAHVHERLPFARPRTILVAGRRQVVADPAVGRARRALPGAHRLVAGIGVRVEAHVLAVELFVGERRRLTRHGRRHLCDLRSRVCYRRRARLGALPTARDGDNRGGDGEGGEMAKTGTTAARHAPSLCKDGTRSSPALPRDHYLFSHFPFGR